MSITKSIKKNSVQMTNVCPHIKASLESCGPVLNLTPVFLERILIGKYYEQYWLSSDFAKELNVAVEGELYFDPKLRALLDDDCDGDDDDFIVELKESLQDCFEKVSLDAFNKKYGPQADAMRNSVDEFKQCPVRD